MATAPGRTPLTPEEYLAIERRAEGRHEFYRGEMFAMGGASYEHTLIVGNLQAALHAQARRGGCRVLSLDLRVLVKATGLYTYPDLVVVCGEPRFLDDAFDTLLNPVVIVEVLSPSTESYDRGRKFAHYRSIPSLRDYVLVAQDRMLVEQYRRMDQGWSWTEAAGPGGRLVLESVGGDVGLPEVYDGITFPDEPAPRGDRPGPPPA